MTAPIRVPRTRRERRWLAATTATAAAGATTMIVLLAAATPATAVTSAPVGLGAATPFAVLAGSELTNTGTTTINGDIGVSPGSAITGFPPGSVVNGSPHAADTTADDAQLSVTTAYDDAATRVPTTVLASSDLTGLTLTPGVYRATSSLGLTGTVVLDGENDINAVFIFQAGSTLINETNSTVSLIRSAQACNVFWQVGSSATVRSNAVFVGTILALTSATVETGATVTGRVLARNGAATLDDNSIAVPGSCITTTPAAVTSAPGPAPAPATGTATGAATGAATGTPTSRRPAAVIPSGHPQTGAGGTAGAPAGHIALGFGAFALVGAGVAMGLAVRRRRRLLATATRQQRLPSRAEPDIDG